MNAPVGGGAAFAAGIASFLSPCVLPLVPGYLSLISGLSLEELSQGQGKTKPHVLGSALCFVLGFSLVFTALGASASTAGRLLSAHMGLVQKAAGSLIVLFGLHLSGLVPLRWLYYEKRLSISGFAAGRAGAFLVGLAFACGWTPCIGPVLGAILALAATQETLRQGVVLLLLYSLGLGLPFLAAAWGLGAFTRILSRYKRYIRWSEAVCGVLLIAVGMLVFSNRLSYLVRFLPHALFRLSL